MFTGSAAKCPKCGAAGTLIRQTYVRDRDAILRSCNPYHRDGCGHEWFEAPLDAAPR